MAQGRLVIGHFGSIYPGKQPNALLEIGAVLKAGGKKPLLVYIGSFIRGIDNHQRDALRPSLEAIQEFKVQTSNY